MQQHALISSCEIKTDPKVGPTCTVTLVRGAQLSFRMCNGQLRKVACQGYATKEEFLVACSVAGQQIRNANKVEVPPPAKRTYSLAGARAHARAIDPHEADD